MSTNQNIVLLFSPRWIGTMLLNACDNSDKQEWIRMLNGAIKAAGPPEVPRDSNSIERLNNLFQSSSDCLDTSKSSIELPDKDVELPEKLAKKGLFNRKSSKPLVMSCSLERSGDKSSVYGKLKAFFQKRPTPEDLIVKGIPIEAMFNAPLSKQVLTSSGIPALVYNCIACIEKTNALDCVGIYRLSGNAAVIQKLVIDFNSACCKVPHGNESDFAFFKHRDPNIIAGLLKRFFREQADCLLTSNMYATFIAMCEIEDYDTRHIALKNVIHTLPDVNLKTLAFLFRHLKRYSIVSCFVLLCFL